MTPRALRAVALAALCLAALSLGISAYLVAELRRAERALEPARALLETMVAPDQTFRTEVRVPAGTPIELDVPIDERVSIRVDTTFPVDARVNVPLRSPLGDYTIPVPLRADVPVRATLPLRLQHTFRLRTRTPSDIVVPIEIAP